MSPQPADNPPHRPPDFSSTTPGPSNAFTFKHASFEEALDDLSCRFILNLPDEELRSIERVCFQVEQAHWYYEDFIREANPKLPSLSLKKFSAELFTVCPMLQHWSHDHELAFNQFMAYKTRVPVCGAIMLNENLDMCVLVKGYKASSGWGFPKGKINQNELESDCAVREVLEETGYNLADKINEHHYITTSVREQTITLFIVPNIPEDFPFKTRTRKEISKIEWFKLCDLPTWKRRKETPGKFYLITPFISQLKDFISRLKHERKYQNGTGGQKVAIEIHSGIIAERSSGEESPTKESSSLSSSTGNGGPTTPSPDRTPFLNAASKSEPPLPALGVDGFIGMDPHLANLLNNLSLSANKLPEQPQPITSKEPAALRRSVSLVFNEPSSVNAKLVQEPSGSLSTSSAEIKVASNTAGDPVRLEPTPLEQIEAKTSSKATSVQHPTKRAKHLALLDSVLEDLPAFAPPLPSMPKGSGPYQAAPFPTGPYPGRSTSANLPVDSQHPLPYLRHQYSSSALLRASDMPPVPVYPGSYLANPPPTQIPHFIPSSSVPPPSAPLGMHQNNLLSLLSPRSRTLSTLQHPLTVPGMNNNVPPPMSLYNTAPTGLTAPPTIVSNNHTPTISRSTNPNLLSILNGGVPSMAPTIPQT